MNVAEPGSLQKQRCNVRKLGSEDVWILTLSINKNNDCLLSIVDERTRAMLAVEKFNAYSGEEVVRAVELISSTTGTPGGVHTDSMLLAASDAFRNWAMLNRVFITFKALPLPSAAKR